MRGRQLTIGVIGILLSASALLVWYVAGQVIHPPWYEHRRPEQGLRPLDGDRFAHDVWQDKTHDPRIDFGYPYDDVEFPTAGAATLRGWLVPGASRTAAIVGVHGGGADRREFMRQLPLFHDAGYTVLLFDCREHGVSDGDGRGVSLGVREQDDVVAAVRYLKRARGFDRVAVIGTSQGGTSAILAAAKDSTIDAVIAENPFTRADELLPYLIGNVAGLPALIAIPAARVVLWRLGGGVSVGPIDVVDKLAPRPILLMHGTADRFIPEAQSEQLFQRAGQPKGLWIAPDAEHAALHNRYPDEWRAQVLGFLAKYLPADAGPE